METKQVPNSQESKLRQHYDFNNSFCKEDVFGLIATFPYKHGHQQKFKKKLNFPFRFANEMTQTANILLS